MMSAGFGDSGSSDTPAVTGDEQPLESMTVVQLKAIAKDRGITGYSNMTKTQLFEVLSQ